MSSTTTILCVVVCLQLAFHSALSIKCRKCFPPMPEDDCKRSDETIECRDFEPLGYDSCIQVEYNGNNTIARTCYRNFMCEGAREWCKIRGPCIVKCCDSDLCNAGKSIRSSIFMLLMLHIIVALVMLALS